VGHESTDKKGCSVRVGVLLVPLHSSTCRNTVSGHVPGRSVTLVLSLSAAWRDVQGAAHHNPIVDYPIPDMLSQHNHCYCNRIDYLQLVLGFAQLTNQQNLVGWTANSWQSVTVTVTVTVVDMRSYRCNID
jgi:hypothetical protein